MNGSPEGPNAPPDADATPAAMAEWLLGEGHRAPAADAATARAWAWALKDLCYAAWMREPARAGRAAAALQALADGHAGDAELAALAAWTGGITALTRGAMAEALALLDRAEAGFVAQGAALLAGQTQVPAMMALSMLGRTDEAAERGERAHAAFVAHGDTAAAAKVQINLGSLRLSHGRYADAVHHYRQAAVLFARGGDMAHSVMADIGLGDALGALGDFTEADRILARAAQRAGHHGLPMLSAMATESVALLQLARGAYGPALQGLEAARRHYEQLDLPQHQATAERELADSYLALRLVPEALALYDKALARFEALDLQPEQARARVQQGRALARLRRPDEARAALGRALALFEATGDAVGPAAVALATAELDAAAGDADASARGARTAIEGYRVADRPDGVLQGELLLARLSLRRGALDAAAQAFERACQDAERLPLVPAQVVALTGLGEVALARGDASAAEAALEAAVARSEELRQALPDDDGLRSAWMLDQLRPYRGLLALALEAFDRAPSTAAAARVVERLDHMRARSLGERLGAAAAPALSPELLDLRSRLNWLYRRLRRAQDEGEATAAVAADLRHTEQALLEGLRRARLADGLTAAAPERRQALAALQAGLQAGDAVLAHGVDGDELFVAVVRRDGVQLRRRLAAWPAVLQAVQAFRFQVDALRHGSAPVARHLDTLTRRAQTRLDQLHELLWAPLANELSGADRLLVVPTGPLGGVPMAVHIGSRLPLSVLPSLRMAQPAPATPTATGGVVVIGESTRLPHAAAEARRIAACHPGARLCLDAGATLSALQQLAPGASLLHLACHAQFRGDSPRFSALHLHDGAATAEWLEGLSLPAGATVVLSACETGLADAGDGDEMVGLVRAFLIAGATRVVASLWPVDDAITATFMTHLHQRLAEGLPCALALADARATVRAAHPHPAHWAGFQQFGNW